MEKAKKHSTKSTTKTVVKKSSAATRSKKISTKVVQEKLAPSEVAIVETSLIELSEKPSISDGKYVFATGRRKRAVANVRLYSGSGDILINKKPFAQYFSFTVNQGKVLQPLTISGLRNDFYFVAQVNGGGINAQAQAVQHGISQALAKISPEVRRLLKKNGMLTRDDRKKERKKPGLKRARRSPQWAKR